MIKQALLTEMADLLDSDGTNYSVFLRAYSGVPASLTKTGSVVSWLIGHDVVLSGIRDTNVTEVIETLRQSLGYVGDDGTGPGASSLKSTEFARLLQDIEKEVVQLSQTAHEIKSFEFVHGHPAYPVFWDFAYLFVGADEHVLLVGSSSD